MEFRDVIAKRRTTRQFADRPVTTEQLLRIVEAGLRAPSFDHKRKWNFLVLTQAEAKMKVLSHTEALKCGIAEPKNPVQEMVKIAFPKQKTMFEQAKAIILPMFKRYKPLDNELSLGRRYMDLAEIWCVIENIFLAVTDEGLANTMRIPVDDEPDLILKDLGCPADYQLP